MKYIIYLLLLDTIKSKTTVKDLKNGLSTEADTFICIKKEMQ